MWKKGARAGIVSLEKEKTITNQLFLCRIKMLSCAGGMRKPGCGVQVLLGWSRWGGKSTEEPGSVHWKLLSGSSAISPSIWQGQERCPAGLSCAGSREEAQGGFGYPGVGNLVGMNCSKQKGLF